MNSLPPALTKDPTLPSFLHPTYLDAKEELQTVWDVWRELKGCKPNYLPKEEAEPPAAYKNRIARTKFDSRFKPALKGHAGLLSQFLLSDDVAPSIVAARDDIDLQGSSIESFLTDQDEAVLRDGGVGILVEHPPQPTDEDGISLIQSAADEQNYGLRPYLVAVDRRNILNWNITYKQGKPFVKRLTIRENRLVEVGDFGVEAKTYYRVLTPGKFDVYELVQSQGKYQKVLVPELSGSTGLEIVPFVWYSVSDSKWFESQPPFLNLAELNIEHYQKRSGLNEVMHKCNLPVPVRKGVKAPPQVAGQPPPMPRLILGPNSVVDVPMDGDFSFAEPKGTAIETTQADIEKLEDSMDRMSLAFLTGGEAEKTATEVVMDSAQTQCSLKNMARRKESTVQRIFALWVLYTGEAKGGSINVNESILQVPANFQEIQVILDAMGVKISNKLGLQMLLERKWLPSDADLDEELKLLDGGDRQATLTTPEAIAAEAARQAQPMPVAA